MRHLHGFVRETRLTPTEWEAGIRFLTACGDITDAERQESILLSDVLGASMQTVTVDDDPGGSAEPATDGLAPTEATVLGPFFVEGAPDVPLGGDVARGAPGEPCWVEGTVRDTAGAPVPGAVLEVWEADEEGLYDVQHGDGRSAARGRLRADEDGRFRFWAVTPTPYPIPHDGPVGELLAATGRSPVRASHLHFLVRAPGRRTLVTHVFVRGCEHLRSDSVFGVRESLVRDFERQAAGTRTPDGREVGGRLDPHPLRRRARPGAMTADGTPPVPEHLVERARALAADGRRLLGITGAPGAGKSTLARGLVAALGPDAVLVPMDGFHLADATLRARGLRERKGAWDTFDVDGYVHLLRRLRDADDEVVHAPDFDRVTDEPVGSAVPVPREVPLVVTEGNYLLSTVGGWGRVAGLLHETWYLEPADDVRLDRLVRRHEAFGKAAKDAEAWARGSDQANADLVAGTRDRADLVVRWD